MVYSHDRKPGDNPVSKDNNTCKHNKSLNMSLFHDNFRTADVEYSFSNTFITPCSYLKIHSLVAFFLVSHKLPEFMFEFAQCIAWKSNRVLAMYGDKSGLHPISENRPQCVR